MCKSTIRLKCRHHRSTISFEIWSKWHHIPSPPLPPPLLFTGFVYIFNDTKFPPTACAPSIAQNITAREIERDSPIYYIDMCVIRKWTIFSNYSTTHKHIGAKLFPWPWIFLKIWSNWQKNHPTCPFQPTSLVLGI